MTTNTTNRKFKNTKFLTAVNSINKMLTSQMQTPINVERVSIRPIMTGEDLQLKTAYMSPDQYYKLITKMAYDCSDFIDRPSKPSFKEFIETFSDIDKQALLLSMYDITYKSTFGKQLVSCPCGKNKFTSEIKVSEIIQPDTFTPFDKTKQVVDEQGAESTVGIKFSEYEFPIKLELNREKVNPAIDLIFHTYIPPISKYLEIYKNISRDELVSRINNTGIMLTNAESLTLITKRLEIVIHKEDDNGEIVKLSEEENDIEAIAYTINNIVVNDVQNVIDQYEAEFDKYAIKLRKPFKCGHVDDVTGTTCDREFDYRVDIEVAMHDRYFRRDK